MDRELKLFLSSLHRLKGIDLSYYSEKFLLRRLNYRMRMNKVEDLGKYFIFIKNHNEEFNKLLNALAINVSEFFRDYDVFDAFKNRCLKELIQRKKVADIKDIRIWSAGCAYGQEAYSIAIYLKEQINPDDGLKIKIWATDVDDDALARAKKGEYHYNLGLVNKFLVGLGIEFYYEGE